jgi:O-methyltransferase involved in polyketide biosynthesis
MRQKQSSTTAEGMALVRAIEASRPEGRRICYDPTARSLPLRRDRDVPMGQGNTSPV